MYCLSPRQRWYVLRQIADELGYAWHVVKKTTRTDAQIVALWRDLPYCQWHYHEKDALRPIHDVHHTRGRLQQFDRPEHCISLCNECHYAVENALVNKRGELLVPNEKLISLLTTVLSTLPVVPASPFVKLGPRPTRLLLQTEPL